ncbi:MAG: chromosome segregation protein SMC [Dethiobacter sp.]|nr:chromosome segregation protein SMC [Dethiobacter sp.]MBS3899772.1 chromosome segregation protein SMC [Dethiobacter sp.]MBS3982427.1 chromosome segregation protein SMC [Dethiobacter sp.]
MFVKRLEMHGFKSFADKAIIELTHGITVVVGPNGCGKSNLTDAVRWVLGEQSAKHLRGLRMEDIIFSGANGRKPVSFAEVSLTLDHSDGVLGLDFQEITVTRRLYRSGESEYLLNKRQCRLKDIQELFMDTGIGREAYSFIGQGRVDEILHARPEERRLIFEEAAGILRYKTRKREAERRLAETAENLLRVGDIIHELAGQLAPLGEQAAAARHYLELRTMLRERDVTLLVHQGRQLRQQWYDVSQRATAAADELLELQAGVVRRETELTELQLSLDEEQSALLAMQREVQRFSSQLEKVQGGGAVNQERIHSLERQLAEGVTYLAELERQEQIFVTEGIRISEEVTAANKMLANAENELQAARQAIENMESSPEVLRSVICRKELDRLSPEIRRLQSDYSRLEVELEQLTERAASLSAGYAEREAELAVLSLTGQELLTEKEKLADEQKRLHSLALANRTKREQNAAQLLEANVLKERQVKELAVVQNKLQLFAELENAMAGYYQGVKSVLAAKRKSAQFAGIFGTVADVLDVPPEYVTAVEAALGAALQNLVADNDVVAKEAIAWLKETREGRATFLPLNILEAPPRGSIPVALKEQQGYIGVAADLIGREERFASVAESLLGRVHLASNLNAALSVARLFRFRERVVTLEGDVILPGGAMTGGREKKQAGVLSRRREAEALQVIVNKMLVQIDAEQQCIKALTMQRDDLAAEEAKLAEKMRAGDLSLGVKENEIVYLTRQKETATRALEGYEREAEVIISRREAKEIELTKARGTLESCQEQENCLLVELAGLAGILSAREHEKRSLQDEYTECRVHLASIQKQLEYDQEELERLRQERIRLAERKKGKETEIKAIKSQRLVLDELVEKGREEATVLDQERMKLLSAVLKREAKLKEKNTLCREEAEQIRQLEKSLTGLERKQARLDVEQGRVEVELQAVLDRLLESWELDFAAAEKLAQPLVDSVQAQTEVQNLKENISALGMVNLGAIDEYERVQERVDFLTRQRHDLLEGEKDLLRVIREMDSRMGEKFAAAFAIISENFGVVFKELFGGGRAQLRLTDQDNLLEAGIEIMAQPPGKKLQHLSLLSGGEKALTAIALLFAFLKVKPTPFCMLDEIEAALDEANLTRFTEYLCKLSGETQFILISHRKKTMEQADFLYGVTMEEAGVSKLISVRLKEAQMQASTA